MTGSVRRNARCEPLPNSDQVPSGMIGRHPDIMVRFPFWPLGGRDSPVAERHRLNNKCGMCSEVISDYRPNYSQTEPAHALTDSLHHYGLTSTPLGKITFLRECYSLRRLAGCTVCRSEVPK